MLETLRFAYPSMNFADLAPEKFRPLDGGRVQSAESRQEMLNFSNSSVNFAGLV